MSEPEETLEWLKVEELMNHLDDLTDGARKFIETLYGQLDPYETFESQVEGNPEKQLKWLNSLYEKHMNEDEEAANDIWDN